LQWQWFVSRLKWFEPMLDGFHVLG
jgi:hypothetical protein